MGFVLFLNVALLSSRSSSSNFYPTTCKSRGRIDEPLYFSGIKPILYDLVSWSSHNPFPCEMEMVAPYIVRGDRLPRGLDFTFNHVVFLITQTGTENRNPKGKLGDLLCGISEGRNSVQYCFIPVPRRMCHKTIVFSLNSFSVALSLEIHNPQSLDRILGTPYDCQYIDGKMRVALTFDNGLPKYHGNVFCPSRMSNMK